ncbi:pectate lyase [Flavobacterium cellulosilyticum]|uniref:Pectinesterase n=1 Tax=Flavobacterium cellulosilyticum TaxID=2541731 RepID=A0A4R5C7H9_9FLAO|nr:pectate lyase [Flavobacterium cellulosilyticum]TDD94083.1 pectate lyase [Flavobacterium cellulosilyticum]
MNTIKKILGVLFILITIHTSAQVHDKSWRSITENKEGEWFASDEAKAIAENVLLYQRNIGGWPKNIQMQMPLSSAEKQQLIALKSDLHDITTDNGATYQEMVFLSKMYRQVPDERYKKAFLLGLDYILEAQYDNGGWPQFYPLKKGYYTHITYNDDSMVNILDVLKEIKDKTDYFSIKPSNETIQKVQLAFDKGIDCILKTQYKQNGVLTVWCAQHDENTLLPAKARAYELPSLSGQESVNIVLLLMSIENPSKEIVNAVDHAVIWLEKTKITGYREDRFPIENSTKKEKVLVKDPNADPMWARFMNLEDNTPFFCDRDGIKKASYAEIGQERRVGYAWYNDRAKKVLKEYPSWKKKTETLTEKVIQKTNSAPKDEFNIVVDKNGSGDFTSIQEAINASKAFPSERITIFIKNGTYYEKVKIPSWNPQISLIGESREKTIITYDDYFNKINLGRNSTFYTYTVLVEGNDCIVKNLTIQNSSGPVGQAVALNVNANRVIISNCSLLGNQDTLYISGEGAKNYFKDCYIEGTTDFIFGEATALFENCIIHNKSNSYITAASTPKDTEFGYVFKNCTLTADEGINEVYLGRPWRIYAKTVYINCKMGKHIKPEGWDNWSKSDAEKTAFYAEYNCSGEGFQPEKRVSWSHQLKKSEAKKYTSKNILGEDLNLSSQVWNQKKQ